MKKRAGFLIYLLLALLSLSTGHARAVFAQEGQSRASVKRPLKTPHRKGSLKTPDRNRGKAVPKSNENQQQISVAQRVAVRSATMNFTELARREALEPATPQELRFVPEPQEEESEEARERPVPEGAKVFRQESALSVAQSLGPSPTASPTFQGVQATGWTPPDTQGAVGPNHLMVAVNGGVLVQSKSGSTIISVRSLVSFFSNVANGSTDVFDPRLQYDPYGNRWILVAVADRQVAASAVLVGVSQTSDPTGNWNLYRIDVDSQDLSWADYPVIGFNKDWIVVSVNMLSNPNLSTEFYSRLFVLNKANFYGGTTGNYTQISAPNNVSGTIVPTSTYDPNLSTMYLLKHWNGNFNGSGYLRLFTITGAVGSEVLNNVSSGVFISTPNPWSFSPPSIGDRTDFAPQLGTTDKIQVNDAGIQNVVYRNGSLWCAHTVFLPTSGATRSSAQWWQINPTSNSVLQFGRIDDPNGNFFYGFPSISVNQNNDVLIGYSRFSSTQYAGAGYAYRAGTDPASSLRDDTVLKAGAGTYSNSFEGRNRWGDYSGTSVDPVNDTDLWTIQEYAAPNNNWGTWWGRIGNAAPPAGPANDNFLNSQVISGNSGSVAGTNVGATKEGGEPVHAGNSGGASIWYQWQAPGNGSVTITTAGSNFDTLLGVYTGSSVNALTPIASNDDDPSAIGVTSKVTFNTVGGTTYRIAIDGFNGATGNITLNWNLQGPTCSYSIFPSSQSFTSGGGTGSVGVTAGTGCTWSASSNATWIIINSGSSGSGNGSVGYTVSANTSSSSRSGIITVSSGQGFTSTYTVNQSAPVNLTVASSNPASGVSITVSPNDINGLGSGTTPLTRTYHNNTVVSLTAPSTAGGNNFQKWQRGGVDYLSTQSVNVTMDAAYTLTAVYVTPSSCPSVTSITPASGVVGSSVTITGNNLSGVTAVKFSNNISAGFTVNSNTQITATVPNGAVTGPITISKTGCSDVQTGAFTVSTTVQVTIQTNPSGRSFTVDGNTYTTPQTFTWTSGASHSISTTTPQSGGTGTQYIWNNWSDGGNISHNVAPTTSTTYTANFTTQYFLTMNAGAGGTVSPSSGWYNSGQSASISATPNGGFSFSSWTGSGVGSFTGASNPATVTMNGPVTETANFNSIVQVTFQTNPTGRSFTVDGSTFTTSQTFNWASGSSHTISTISPQSGGTGTQYVWSSWSDGGLISHNVVPTTNTTYTANFTTQYFLTMNAGTGGTVSPSSNWFNAGQSVQITASPNSGFNFGGWSGSGTGAYTGPNNPATVAMNGPITETASFREPLRLDSVSPVAGRTSGGQQVKLSGSFAGLLNVMLGGTQSTWSYSNGTIEIIVTTPAHAVGAVAIDLVPSSGNIVTRATAFAYLTTVFTDNQLFVGVTTAKAQHILELRRAVDALRAVAGLQAAQWTDPGLSPGAQIKAVHIRELRSYLEAAAIQLGYAPVQYTDPSLGAGSIIKRVHIEELRQRIRAIAG
jgi:hypothetical protein